MFVRVYNSLQEIPKMFVRVYSLQEIPKMLEFLKCNVRVFTTDFQNVMLEFIAYV